VDIFKQIRKLWEVNMPRAKKKTTATKNNVGEAEIGRLMFDALELYKNNCKSELLKQGVAKDSLGEVSTILEAQETYTRNAILDQVSILFKT